MDKPRFKERIRRDLLKKRGLVRTGYGHIEDKPDVPHDPRKTLAMRLLEAQFDCPIEELLVLGGIREVGNRLGIDSSTVSKWRLRLGLRNGTAVGR